MRSKFHLHVCCRWQVWGVKKCLRLFVVLQIICGCRGNDVICIISMSVTVTKFEEKCLKQYYVSHSSEQNPPKLSKSGTISTANAESVASRLLAPHEYTSINSTTHAGICKSARAVLSSFVDGLHLVAAYKDFKLWCSFRCLKNASSGPRRVWKQQCRVYRRGKGY